MISNKKTDIVALLNWDYNVSNKELLAIIAGSTSLTDQGKEKGETVFDVNKLFIRSLERLNWLNITYLWGIDKFKELYTTEISKQLFPKQLKQKYDFTAALLRGETVSATEWGTERAKQLQHTFLSHRWNRTQQSIL